MTTRTQLTAAVLAGALVGQLILTLLDLAGTFPPVVPWSVPAMLAVMAVAAWIYSRGLGRRVRDHSVGANEAVRALIVAKSAMMTGGVLAGMHVVYILRWLPHVQAATPGLRVLLGGVTLATSVLLVVGGRALEKACVVPDDPGGDSENSESPTG